MSATGRGAARKPSDNYRTPEATIRSFLTWWLSVDPHCLDGVILDPCCGGGPDFEPPYPKVVREFVEPAYLYVSDIRDCGVRTPGAIPVVHDFLDPEWNADADTIISNPPYSLAREFIEKGLKCLPPGGRMAFLLRLNFLGAQKRHEFWQDHMPTWVAVHSKRPSFTAKGTDACDYAHFVWSAECQDRVSKLVVIP